MQPNHPTRNGQGSVTNSPVSQNLRDMGHPGLAGMRAEAALNSPVRFPGEDGGCTLAEMAQRDLDAALQLLADRAQFITGASGAAIALRCAGRNDMQCRASAGATAPELGALLSTEFGLSGESVRTRQLLRCDDAARDARVNQEACRRLGIASVVVMPVVNDDEVLGVFELFSGQANAFGDRDLSAVQRLTEMVETAVRLANASLNLPHQLEIAAPPAEVTQDASEKKDAAEEMDAAQVKPAGKIERVKIGEVKIEEIKVEETSGEVIDEDILLDALEADAEQMPAAASQPAFAASVPSTAAPAPQTSQASSEDEEIIEVTPASPRKDRAAEKAAAPAGDGESGSGDNAVAVGKANVEAAPKPLFWSAANAEVGSEKTGEGADQSHVPPVLRGLRKCEACGFPISGGRTLCVECEEKKWRGQLPKPQAAAPAVAISQAALRKPEGQAFAAAAQASAGAASAVTVAESAVVPVVPAAKPKERLAEPEEQIKEKTASEATSTAEAADSPAPELVLSATLEPSPSWLARNKYIVGVALAVAAAVTAAILLR